MDPSLGNAKASFKTRKKKICTDYKFSPIKRRLIALNKLLGKTPSASGIFPNHLIFVK